MKHLIAACLLLLVSAAAALDLIADCGGLSRTGKPTVQEAQSNTQALELCLAIANASVEASEREVVVPKGSIINSYGFQVDGLHDVVLRIDGLLEASPHYEQWPLNAPGMARDFLHFRDCSNITVVGEGQVEGGGYEWWVREYKKKNPSGRPHMLVMERVQTAEIAGVRFTNSPRWHLKLTDVDSVYVHDLEIFVSILKQKDPLKKHHPFVAYTLGKVLEQFPELASFVTHSELSIPTNPANTDGIDPAGSNITIRNVNITNFNDAISVKHSDKASVVAKDGCSQDILVEHVNIMFSEGMAVGSVAPSLDHRCARRITFRDVSLEWPIKSIYVKTNPGDEGSGEISDILYEDFRMHNPLWWNIYIGPQQLKQHHDAGCLTYPFGRCKTQPLVPIQNVTLRNIKSHGGVFPPGVIRCNSTNECKGFVFDRVEATGWWEQMGWGYITEYVEGEVRESVPRPHFGKRSHEVFDLYSWEHIAEFVLESVHFYRANKTDITAWEVLLGFIVWGVSLIF